MDTRMVAAVRGAWAIMAIRRGGKEVAGVEIMVDMADMEEEDGITNLKVLNEIDCPGSRLGSFPVNLYGDMAASYIAKFLLIPYGYVMR